MGSPRRLRSSSVSQSSSFFTIERVKHAISNLTFCLTGRAALDDLLGLGGLLPLGLLNVDHALHKVFVGLELSVAQELVLVALMDFPPQLHVRHLLLLLQQTTPSARVVRLCEVRI